MVTSEQLKAGLKVMAAAYEGREEIFQLLMGHGADLRAVDQMGWTALKCAEARKQFKIVKAIKHRLASSKQAGRRSS